MNIIETLKGKRLFTDGSMGTYYSGLVQQPGALSELANLSSPETIEQIHRDYIAAGANLLRTNTFAANSVILKLEETELQELIHKACTIAKKAVAKAKAEDNSRELWILGDLGPIPQHAGMEEEEVLREYRKICDIFIEEELDGIHFETFSSPYYIEKLLPYLKERKPELFLMASFSVNRNGYTQAGFGASRLLNTMCQMEGIDAFGFNCGVGSGHMYQLLKKLELPENKLIFVAPNAGYPEQMQNRMVFLDNEQYYTDNMNRIAELGVDILGGCCGTTPDYITSLVQSIGRNKGSSHARKGGGAAKVSVRPSRENEFLRLLNKGKKVIAVELDPPFDANIDQVMEGAHRLKACGTDIITFADSPRGRSRVDSMMMGMKIAQVTGVNVMPHLCCRDRNMISMRSILLGGYIHGIRNLCIVTGDPVPGENRLSTTGVFDYNSIQLMEYVKEMNTEHFTEDPICYGGALNQGRGSLDKIIERMKRKIEAGASYFMTQPIYTLEEVERIRRIKESVDTKILCGILPFVSYRNARFIRNEMTGIHVPEEMVNRYYPEMSREEAEQVGVELALEMMALLEPVADGYYFMLPFNRVSMLEKILGK